MEKIDKLKVFKEKGWEYEPDTGEIRSHLGKSIKEKYCRVLKDGEIVQLLKHIIAWYFMTGEVKSKIYHIDNNIYNNKWDNLTDICPFRPRKKKDKPKKLKKIKRTIIKDEISPYKRLKYWDNDIFQYEIIISNGKGELTPKAKELIIKMSDEMIKKFSNKYKTEDDKYDCKIFGLVPMLENWQSYDYLKYDNSFTYFSEICKRGIAGGLNKIKGKKQGINPIAIVSLEMFYSV